MRLIQLIFYFTVGYLLWKLVRSVMRTLNRSDPGPSRGPAPSDGPSPKPKIFKEEEIKDAQFEDITPPPGTASKTSAH